MSTHSDIKTSFGVISAEVAEWEAAGSRFHRVRMIAERQFANNLAIYDGLYDTAVGLFPGLKKSEVEPVILSGASRAGIAAIEFNPEGKLIPPTFRRVGDRFFDPKLTR